MLLLIILLPLLTGALLALPQVSKATAALVYRILGAAEMLLALWLWLFPEQNVLLPLSSLGLHGILGLFGAGLFCLSGLMAPLSLPHYGHEKRYYCFTLMTMGATLGAFYATHLVMLFLLFEMASLLSYPMVSHRETPEALRAAGLYLGLSIASGLVTLMGMFLLIPVSQDLFFTSIRNAAAAGTIPAAVPWLLLAGFGTKAGLYPLHVWLPRAHPVAPAPASALLSGILTKTGVFGVMMILAEVIPGAVFGKALLVLALATMVWGGLMALFASDLKVTLAYSSMSQLGFILLGLAAASLLGEEGSLAAAGAIGHAMNHILMKGVLFLAAGVMALDVHTLDTDHLRGYGRRRPLLHLWFLLGAVSMMGIPFVGGGYVSKTLLHEGLTELIHHTGGRFSLAQLGEWLFILSGGMTVAYMTKWYILLFWEKPAMPQAAGETVPLLPRVAMTAAALAMPVMGLLPGVTLFPLIQSALPTLHLAEMPHVPAVFSGEALTGGAIPLGVGAVLYLAAVLLLQRRAAASGAVYRRFTSPLSLADGLYVPLFSVILPAALTLVCRALGDLPDAVGYLLHEKLFRKQQRRPEPPVGNRFTYGLGTWINALAQRLNRSVLRNHPMPIDYEYTLAAAWKTVTQGGRTISRSVSFGLMLLTIGLVVTIFYLVNR